jgi:hypothetical protein
LKKREKQASCFVKGQDTSIKLQVAYFLAAVRRMSSERQETILLLLFNSFALSISVGGWPSVLPR